MNLASLTIHETLNALASKEPTPGGGAVAGLLAALSGALGRMVLAYSVDREDSEPHKELHDDCIVFLKAASEESLLLGDADAKAYEKVNALWKLPKDDPSRVDGWNAALQEATNIPIQTMELSDRILKTLEKLPNTTNTMLASDLAIAALLAETAAKVASWNVRVNLQLMEDSPEIEKIRVHTESLLAGCKAKANAIENSCKV